MGFYQKSSVLFVLEGRCFLYVYIASPEQKPLPIKGLFGTRRRRFIFIGNSYDMAPEYFSWKHPRNGVRVWTLGPYKLQSLQPNLTFRLAYAVFSVQQLYIFLIILILRQDNSPCFCFVLICFFTKMCEFTYFCIKVRKVFYYVILVLSFKFFFLFQQIKFKVCFKILFIE